MKLKGDEPEDISGIFAALYAGMLWKGLRVVGYQQDTSGALQLRHGCV